MLKQLLILVLVFTYCQSVHFKINLDSYQKQCFYESLQMHQKYTVDLNPINLQGSSLLYQLQVSNMIEGSWNSLVYKQTKSSGEHINVHKLAPTQSTYAYCIRNVGNQRLTLSVNIQSGLELLQFQLLPQKSDAENLQRQISWIEGQKQKLFQILQRMDGLRSTSESLTNLMSTKMIGFAIIGLVSIIVINVLFYKQVKKTFKQRKLI